MIVNRNHFIAPREREALISLTAIAYIEEHALLARAQLDDAKRSLQALFLRASGEETMLRKLIEALKATRQIHHSFARISDTLAGAAKSVRTIEEKFTALKTHIAQAPITAEAHDAFIGRFLSFSQHFINDAAAFADSLSEYLAAREQMARAQSLYVIARDAREQLRQRLTGHLGQTSSAIEPEIKAELVSSFDYGEAEAEMEEARNDAQTKQRDLQDHLHRIGAMCRAVGTPTGESVDRVDAKADLTSRFGGSLSDHPCLERIAEPVQELLKLYYHSHSVFQLDYQKLNGALDMLLDNVEIYFQAKDEDRDLHTKREKLRKIEGLILFLERAAQLTVDESAQAYPTFSRQLSAQISERRAPWGHIAEDLLRAKVQAEAEISARL